MDQYPEYPKLYTTFHRCSGRPGQPYMVTSNCAIEGKEFRVNSIIKRSEAGKYFSDTGRRLLMHMHKRASETACKLEQRGNNGRK